MKCMYVIMYASMDVSRETPDVTTKPKCYDLSNILVRNPAVALAFRSTSRATS